MCSSKIFFPKASACSLLCFDHLRVNTNVSNPCCTHATQWPGCAVLEMITAAEAFLDCPSVSKTLELCSTDLPYGHSGQDFSAGRGDASRPAILLSLTRLSSFF